MLVACQYIKLVIHRKQNQRDGFTLVELSIVLVIIGLLIGGILVGQSLIDSAKTQTFVREISQFDIAIRGFKSKYNKLPGDAQFFDIGGNGNNLLETINSPLFESEVSNFWRHLSQDGFQPNKVIYSNDASSGVISGVHIPIMSGFTGANGGKIGAVVLFSPSIMNIPNYYIADYSNTTTSNITAGIGGGLTPIEALAIDKKIDDGKARASNPDQFSGVVSESGVIGGCSGLAPDSTYAIDNTEKRCVLNIKILSGNNF